MKGENSGQVLGQLHSMSRLGDTSRLHEVSQFAGLINQISPVRLGLGRQTVNAGAAILEIRNIVHAFETYTKPHSH